MLDPATLGLRGATAPWDRMRDAFLPSSAPSQHPLSQELAHPQQRVPSCRPSEWVQLQSSPLAWALAGNSSSPGGPGSRNSQECQQQHGLGRMDSTGEAAGRQAGQGGSHHCPERVPVQDTQRGTHGGVSGGSPLLQRLLQQPVLLACSVHVAAGRRRSVSDDDAALRFSWLWQRSSLVHPSLLVYTSHRCAMRKGHLFKAIWGGTWKSAL